MGSNKTNSKQPLQNFSKPDKAKPVVSKKKKPKVYYFHTDWELDYFFISVGGKSLCLICNSKLKCQKKGNLKQHHETQHKGFESQFPINSNVRKTKLQSLKNELQAQQREIKSPLQSDNGATLVSLEKSPLESDKDDRVTQPTMTSNPEHFYHSSLITTRQNVAWTIHNLSELVKHSAWTAYSCTLEIPFSTHRISKWNVSLYENANVVYIRPRLVSPQNETLTYQLSVKIAGDIIPFGVTETTNKEKNQPKFNIGSVQSFLQKSLGDELQLELLITVFDQDHWEVK